MSDIDPAPLFSHAETVVPTARTTGAVPLPVFSSSDRPAAQKPRPRQR